MPGDGERSEDELGRTATAPGSSSAAAASGVPVLGDTLGRYRLERELGAGGMGVVHAAFDPDLERRVALKVLRTAQGGEARQRLLREARALARLTHANVVTVHEVGSANGRDYVAMELIEGETLADWLKAAPRSEAEIIGAFSAAGRGLAAAHAAGLVHRDFKPHNVLRRKDGRIVVTDFGLARGIEVALELETTLRAKGQAQPAAADNTPSSLSGLTETGSVLGTPAYMAPEQWSGDSVGPAADQFAFCVALWEALAGERPFRGATLEALHAQVRRGPRELDDSKLPRRLRAPLKRGLDPEPARRWPNMDALLAAVSRAERPRGVLLMIAGAALAATGVGYAVVASDDADSTLAVPTCELPVLEPAEVWSTAIANAVRDRTSSEIMRRFDADIAAWQAARSVACGLDTPMRARRLACLDGVIARFDAVRKASMQGAKPSLDEVSAQLVEPGACNVDEPPRLPAKLSDAAATAFALAYEPDPDKDFDEQAEAEVLRVAGDDRCARTYARLARAMNDASTKARDAADEALELAEACGDDRARADALVSSLAKQLTPFLDPKLQKALAAAEAAVRKVAQPDLVATLDLIKAGIAGASGQWDEQIKLAESAIRGFGERRPLARLAAVQTKVGAMQARKQPGDLRASRSELARWRAEAQRVGRPRLVTALDALDVAAQWELGDIAGAAARFPELYARGEAQRAKPLTDGTTIGGVVVDQAGKPAAGAVVAAGPAVFADSVTVGYLAPVQNMRIATADSTGRYKLDHVPANSIIVAQAGEQRSRVRSARDGDKLVLQPTARISGRVVDREPHQLTVFAVPAEPGMSPMYQMIAPVAADGTFTIDRVPIGRLRIGAAHSTGGLGQSFTTQEITVGAKGRSNVEVRRASDRKLRVVVRSSVNVPLSGAQVLVVAGMVSIRTVKEIETVLRTPGMSMEMARSLTGETPPELGKLVPGDLVATFKTAPTGVATACAIGLTGDLGDPGFRDKLQKHIDELEVKCVPIGPDAKAATIEVPPMKRLD
jgi:predicted Ser/Thr protein kinase